MSIHSNIPLWVSLLFIGGGLTLLAWSADRFVTAAAHLAHRLGIPPLVVGIVIIGFGTSAPELCVSALSGLAGCSNLSLGNAYGSCIFNIGAIIGLAALVRPIRVRPLAFMGSPVLALLAVLSLFLISDGSFSRGDGICLLVVFAIVFPLYCCLDYFFNPTPQQVSESSAPPHSLAWEILWILLGLILLVLSSHVLVWGCVDFARDVLHVSNLLIGLTVVAIGTSLPELASALASARKGENEFVVGNIIGSNLFNTLAVVGVAGTLAPFQNFSPYILSRDLPVMIVFSLLLGLFGINHSSPSASRPRTGEIVRWEGALLLLGFLIYLAVMIPQEVAR